MPEEHWGREACSYTLS